MYRWGRNKPQHSFLRYLSGWISLLSALWFSVGFEWKNLFFWNSAPNRRLFCNSGFHLGYQIGYIGEGEINLSIHSWGTYQDEYHYILHCDSLRNLSERFFFLKQRPKWAVFLQVYVKGGQQRWCFSENRSEAIRTISAMQKVTWNKPLKEFSKKTPQINHFFADIYAEPFRKDDDAMAREKEIRRAKKAHTAKN